MGWNHQLFPWRIHRIHLHWSHRKSTIHVGKYTIGWIIIQTFFVSGGAGWAQPDSRVYTYFWKPCNSLSREPVLSIHEIHWRIPVYRQNLVYVYIHILCLYTHVFRIPRHFPVRMTISASVPGSINSFIPPLMTGILMSWVMGIFFTPIRNWVDFPISYPSLPNTLGVDVWTILDPQTPPDKAFREPKHILTRYLEDLGRLGLLYGNHGSWSTSKKGRWFTCRLW